MKTFKFLLFIILIVFPLNAFCGGDLYSYIYEKRGFFEAWNFKFVDYGLHLFSKEKIANSKGESISSITIDIEGPALVKRDTTLDQVIQSNLKAIYKSFPINPDYRPKSHVGDGLGAAIVNINGTKAGIIEYEVASDLGMKYARHELILKG